MLCYYNSFVVILFTLLFVSLLYWWLPGRSQISPQADVRVTVSAVMLLDYIESFKFILLISIGVCRTPIWSIVQFSEIQSLRRQNREVSRKVIRTWIGYKSHVNRIWIADTSNLWFNRKFNYFYNYNPDIERSFSSLIQLNSECDYLSKCGKYGDLFVAGNVAAYLN